MKIKIPKPDLKGGLAKLKNLKKEDVITWWKERKERRARILEARRNSAFAKKMQPVYAFMNRFSLLFHALLACILNFVIEAISRHSVIEAGAYMIGTPLVFLYNAFMIFITFSIVYFFKRRIFVRIIISVFWLVLGVANGVVDLRTGEHRPGRPDDYLLRCCPVEWKNSHPSKLDCHSHKQRTHARSQCQRNPKGCPYRFHQFFLPV